MWHYRSPEPKISNRCGGRDIQSPLQLDNHFHSTSFASFARLVAWLYLWLTCGEFFLRNRLPYISCCVTSVCSSVYHSLRDIPRSLIKESAGRRSHQTGFFQGREEKSLDGQSHQASARALTICPASTTEAWHEVYRSFDTRERAHRLIGAQRSADIQPCNPRLPLINVGIHQYYGPEILFLVFSVGVLPIRMARDAIHMGSKG